MIRVLLAGIAGGVVLFCWGAFSHMVLPLGEVGVKTMPNEMPVMTAMKSNINESGLYFYPGLVEGHAATAEQQAVWGEKYKAGPRGILIYHPTGADPMSTSFMAVELLSNILSCIIAAFVISLTVSSFFGRIISSTIFGVVAWLSIDVSYWNWYGFPTDYITAQGVGHLVGWLLAGIPIAALIKGRG